MKHTHNSFQHEIYIDILCHDCLHTSIILTLKDGSQTIIGKGFKTTRLFTCFFCPPSIAFKPWTLAFFRIYFTHTRAIFTQYSSWWAAFSWAVICQGTDVIHHLYVDILRLSNNASIHASIYRFPNPTI